MLKSGVFVLVGLIHGFPIHKHLNLKLRAPKGKTVTLAAAMTFPEKTSILVSEWRPTLHISSLLPDTSSSSSPDSSVDVVSEGFSQKDEMQIVALFSLRFQFTYSSFVYRPMLINILLFPQENQDPSMSRTCLSLFPPLIFHKSLKALGE